MFLVKVRTTFSAALRLYRPEWDSKKNFEVYGPCSGENGHGHNYELEVTLLGALDPETGMVVNFYDLDKMVEEHLHEAVDHKNLNFDVPLLSGLVPTSENVAVKFWEVLEPLVAPHQLFAITIGEKHSNIVTYLGPHPSPADRLLAALTSTAAPTASLPTGGG